MIQNSKRLKNSFICKDEIGYSTKFHASVGQDECQLFWFTFVQHAQLIGDKQLLSDSGTAYIHLHNIPSLLKAPFGHSFHDLLGTRRHGLRLLYVVVG